MKKHLSIGEVAKMLGTTTHNIRYYEKEGLLKEPKKTEKGYRLFSFEDIYTLSTIMLLRDSNVSIKEIRKLFDDFDTSVYKDIMIKSSGNLEKEIKRLKSIKKEVDNIIDDFDKIKVGFYTKYIKKRKVIVVKNCSYEENISEREIYEFINKYNIKEDGLYKIDFYYIINMNSISYCIPCKKKPKGAKGVTFDEGDYLCYIFFAGNDEEIEKEIEKYLYYIEKEKLNTCGEIIVQEKNKENLHYAREEKQLYEVQIRLKGL